MDWFIAHKLDEQYDFRVAWFTTAQDNFSIAKQRAAMPNDLDVRRKNTCTMQDFQDAGVKVDFVTRPRDNKPNPELIKLVQQAIITR